jgi:hypothetical protein
LLPLFRPTKKSDCSGLFKGREDVYAVRWEGRNGKAGYSPACAKRGFFASKVEARANREFLPLTDLVVRDHLSGKLTVGVYPLLNDETCWFRRQILTRPHSSILNRLMRLAAFQNPEFYRAQAMRLSTFGKPRVIHCAEEFPRRLGLPRGCQSEVVELLESYGIRAEPADERSSGSLLPVTFHGGSLDSWEQGNFGLPWTAWHGFQQTKNVYSSPPAVTSAKDLTTLGLIRFFWRCRSRGRERFSNMSVGFIGFTPIKRKSFVYDYTDDALPMLAAMFRRSWTGGL